MRFFLERKRLVELCKKIYNEDLVIGTWGNFSIRVDKSLFIITPSGMNYETLKPEDIVVSDLNNNIIEGSRKPSIEINLHSLIYENRKDINGIIHTHSNYTKVFSIARKPIPPVSEDLVQIVGGSVDVAEYRLPGTKELGEQAILALKDKMAVLLANHGLVSVGRDIDEALKVAIVAENNAKSILFTYLIGGPVILSDEDVKIMRDFYLNKYGQNK